MADAKQENILEVLPFEVDVLATELMQASPGLLRCRSEALLQDERLVARLATHLAERPEAFLEFGHSLTALIACSTALNIMCKFPVCSRALCRNIISRALGSSKESSRLRSFAKTMLISSVPPKGAFCTPRSERA